ncbi:DUF488 domain-containing protein [Levilactobacillus acidifarinae]|uniref:DUF488 domain-containing protein n=1 Tax=Levilactobacillus acidifarinae TaxID=267364 RepID=UPI00070AB8DB|nr:DUF488 family protein [Levilactobacillus acidifarinae]GEO69780.1 hypothetical protein LAC03_16900 [Levilactobacillus acidifarinae]
MALKLERIYTKPADLTGYRVLVDRLWPRGISKVNAHLDHWDKEIGPSTDLRKWFNHDPEKFSEFKTRYLAELKANPALPAFLQQLTEQLATQDVILLYGAKDETHNQAVVLKAFLQAQLAGQVPAARLQD